MQQKNWCKSVLKGAVVSGVREARSNFPNLSIIFNYCNIMSEGVFLVRLRILRRRRKYRVFQKKGNGTIESIIAKGGKPSEILYSVKIKS